jgi:hypothetical protein
MEEFAKCNQQCFEGFSQLIFVSGNRVVTVTRCICARLRVTYDRYTLVLRNRY